MKVLLTSAGLEAEPVQTYFMSLLKKDVTFVKALFIPTAAIEADAIAVLPKCMDDLLKCGIQKENITVYDLHIGMSIDELLAYDVVYICGGNTQYLLNRINEADFDKTLMRYMQEDKIVLGVSAGKVDYPIKSNIKLTNATALAIRDFPNGIEVIG